MTAAAITDDTPRTSLLHLALGLEQLTSDIPASFPRQQFWHAVYTQPRHELTVKRDIEKLGYRVFCPMSSRRVTKRGKRVILNDPLFTRYVFVLFDRERDDWGAILDVKHVEYMLRSQSGMPIFIRNKEIEKFIRLEKNGAFDYTNRKLNLAEGDRVEIQEGPFAGLIAKVKSASPKKRVRLLLESLASIEIDPAAIVRV